MSKFVKGKFRAFPMGKKKSNINDITFHVKIRGN